MASLSWNCGWLPEDMGKVIGRQGRIAKEIRAVDALLWPSV